MKQKYSVPGSGIIAAIVLVGIVGFIGLLIDATDPKCKNIGCDNECASGSDYCYIHKPYSGSSSSRTIGSGSSGHSTASKSSASTSVNSSTGSSTSRKSSSSNTSSTKRSSYDSYDDGYNDVNEDDDYDLDRYYEDDDYADGVDDAMEDEDW